MSMFDNIKVKKDLPLTEELKNLPINWKEVTFQTKDLDNCLFDYFITEDGELVCEHVELEYVYYTEEERKQKGHRPWDLVKETIEKSRHNEKVNLHGKISFYSMETISETEEAWIDFEAYFIYGKLDKIELLKVEKHKSKKYDTEKWVQEMQKRKNSFSHKLGKYTGWFWLWKQIGKTCVNTSHVLQDANRFIYNHLIG